MIADSVPEKERKAKKLMGSWASEFAKQINIAENSAFGLVGNAGRINDNPTRSKVPYFTGEYR